VRREASFRRGEPAALPARAGPPLVSAARPPTPFSAGISRGAMLCPGERGGEREGYARSLLAAAGVQVKCKRAGRAAIRLSLEGRRY